MRKLMKIAVLTIALLVGIGTAAHADTIIGGLRYSLDTENKTATLIKAFSTERLLIPSEVTYGDVTYSVTMIGTKAFEGKSFDEVSIPASVTKLKKSAFTGIKAIRKLTIEDADTELYCADEEHWVNNDGAFDDCAVEEFYMGRNLTIDEGKGRKHALFCDRQGSCAAQYTLKNIKIGPKVTKIPMYAFGHLKAVDELVIPANVKKIGKLAFFFMRMNRLVIEDSDETLELEFDGEQYFDERLGDNTLYAARVNSFYMGRNLDYGDYLFKSDDYNETDNLTKIEIGSKVTKIPSGFLSNVNNLKTFIFDEGCHLDEFITSSHFFNGKADYQVHYSQYSYFKKLLSERAENKGYKENTHYTLHEYVTIDETGWAAAYFNKDSKVPNNTSAYAITEATTNSATVTAIEASNIKAHTPILLCGVEGRYLIEPGEGGVAPAGNLLQTSSTTSTTLGDGVAYYTLGKNAKGEAVMQLAGTNIVPEQSIYLREDKIEGGKAVNNELALVGLSDDDERRIMTPEELLALPVEQWYDYAETYHFDEDGKMVNNGTYRATLKTWAKIVLANREWTNKLPNPSTAERPVVKMHELFKGCTGLVSVDLSDWDVTGVVTMNGMFSDCSNLRSITLPKKWDTSSVTDFSYMFSACYRLDVDDLRLAEWDVSSATTMEYMFAYCDRIFTFGATGWNTSKVTNIQGMFGGCSNLVSADLTDWDMTATTNIGFLFINCRNLESVALPQLNTTAEHGGMFHLNTNLQTIRMLGTKALTDDQDLWFTKETNSVHFIVPAGTKGWKAFVDVFASKNATLSYATKVNQSGWGTTWFETAVGLPTAPSDTTIVDDNIEVNYTIDTDAYYVTAANDGIATLTMAEGGIPANQGVIINTSMESGQTSKELLFPVLTDDLSDETKANAEANLLLPAPESGTLEKNSAYVLGPIDDHTVGLLLYAGGAIGTDKAYLPKSSVNGVGNVKALKFYINNSYDNPTAIEAIDTQEETADDAPIYNLQGQRVQTMQRGQIYIIGGKKIIKK